MIENSIQISDYQTAKPKGLVPFRGFAEAMNHFSDFEEFRRALMKVVMEDSGYAGLLELDADMGSMGDDEVGNHFEMDSLVVPLRAGEEKGYIRFMGNENGRPFDAEDLMWIGAISEFVSVAYANSKAQHQSHAKVRIFQYLINQLPLGVVCFDSSGDLLVENKLASRLLGRSGAELIRGALSEKSLLEQGKVRLHLEVDGKLLYTEGRRLEVEEGVSVSAFVLHDMSASREKLMLQLERSVYRAESRGVPLTVAVFEDRSEAGFLYRELKGAADSLQIGPSNVLPLDAYSCACIFADMSLRSVRSLLKNTLPKALDRSSAQGALISRIENPSEESPAQILIDEAQEALSPLSELFRPSMLVLDSYPAVIEALDLIASEICALATVGTIEQAQLRIASGEFDGIFLDIDSFGEGGLDWLEDASQSAGSGFQIFYMSHMHPGTVYKNYGLGVDAVVFQKPFDAERIRLSLSSQFDFA